MGKTIKGKIADLVLDDANANKGTEEGQGLIEQSIANLGLGRSVVVDKNNKLIAGNKTTTGAIEQGVENIVIVETTGDELVVVRRTDLDLSDDDHRARALALADNYTAQQNLNWNPEHLGIHFDAAMSLDMQEFVFEIPGAKGNKTNKHDDLSGNLEKMFKIELEFVDEDAQKAAFDELTKLGYECRILTL